jgi:PAS domain S-box-containing protein
MLQDNPAFFRSTFDHGVGMAVADPEGRFVHCNPAFCAMLGYAPAELAGRLFAEVLDNDEIPLIAPEPLRLADATSIRGVQRFRRKNGSTFIGEALSCKWPDGHIQTTVLDVTERMHAEEEVRLTIERFQLPLKGSPVTIFCQDLDLRYTYVYNPTFGTGASEILGKLQDDVFESANEAKAIKLEVIHSGENRRREVAIRSGGVDRFYDLLAEPLRDGEGKIVGVRCASIDITERKRAEAALRESDERLRFCLKGANAGAWQWDILEGAGLVARMLRTSRAFPQARQVGV